MIRSDFAGYYFKPTGDYVQIVRFNTSRLAIALNNELFIFSANLSSVCFLQTKQRLNGFGEYRSQFQGQNR